MVGLEGRGLLLVGVSGQARAGGREWLGPAEVKQRKGPWETCPYDLGGEQCVTKPVAVLVNR